MWSKLTAHIGVWLANIDREQSRLRESYSLSALNHRQLNIVRTSKSSDNIHRVTFRASPQVARKSSIFSLRKSRKNDKKKKINATDDGSKQKEMNRDRNSNDNQTEHDLMTRSWNPNLPTSRSIFNFWKPSRSRSTNNNLIAVTDTSYEAKQTTSKESDVVVRRRRPRSTHFDSNLLILTPEKTNSIQDINELYRKIDKLGEGSYAVVYKSERKADGRIVALKEIKLHNHEGLPFTAIREASLLRALQHANIVTLHDIIYEHNHLVFVFEYMKTDLGKYLENFRCGLRLVEVKLFLFQLLRGLAFCHERKILHRDLKPQNLLLNETGELKLADFGLARAKSVPSRTFSHEVVTLWYRPPDVLLGSTNYSTSLDMWGVGCIFAEMCTGYALFPGTKDIIDQLHRIFGIRGVPNSERWPEVSLLPHFNQNFFPPYRELPWKDVHSALPKLNNGQSLLSLFLQLNPVDRISASAAMMHPYFSNLPSKIHLLPPTLSVFSLPEVCKMLH